MKVLYIVQRYLPFVDTVGLVFYRKLYIFIVRFNRSIAQNPRPIERQFRRSGMQSVVLYQWMFVFQVNARCRLALIFLTAGIVIGMSFSEGMLILHRYEFVCAHSFAQRF
jgi:hypothetical protein